MKIKKLLGLLVVLAIMTGTFAACGEEAVEAPVETPAVETNIVEEAAMAYFANLPENLNMIGFEDVMTEIDVEEEMFVIDSRSPDDYSLGHVQGAVNMPFTTTTIGENIEFIPDDVPVYVYCYSGQTASQITAVLNVAGKSATNIKGGFLRGIAVTDGYEEYLDTVEVTIPTEVYEVDPEIKAAVETYFETVTSYNGTDTANQNISPAMVKDIIDAESDEYLILSVRKAEDFAKGHLAGAMNIPWGAGMQDSFADLPKDKKIVVYCYSGQTASQTVAILRLLGYEAYNMSYGMGSVESEKGWLGSGYKTVTQ